MSHKRGSLTHYMDFAGNFDVASHIQGENSHAHQIGFSMYTYVYMAMIAGGGLFL